MAARIVIAAPQNRVRDCYASAPNLDLTLRSNGEEKVQIMDSYGQFTQAGFDPPTLAPTLSLGGGGGLANGWVGYIYVYAAKFRYPLVDAGTSAGGSIAPRSNPSPSGNIQVVGGPKHVLVVCGTTTRQDVSHIWIYRTLTFPTQQEAIDNANAGTAFYIGEVINDPNVPTVQFDDSITVGGTGEECDTDNFTAPQFRVCAYFDPYFYGFGNDPLTLACTLAIDGSFAMIASDATKIFSGRNGQPISFQGITSGGFDGHGNYYYLQTSDYGGRIMIDSALTVYGTPEFTGDTFVTFKGQSNILYRSKEHNPLAWGTTDVVANIRIPHLYAFRIGGGQGKAIAIIANLNLLKLDTEGPSISYVLNLRLAGTDSFESSKRELSRNFAVANHFTQFSTQTPNGNTVLWGYDFKSFAILQCDGTNQIPISDKVYDTLRTLTDSEFNHAIYDDKTELACFWFSIHNIGFNLNNFAVLYHVPTGNWTFLDDTDVSCSATIWDSVADTNKTIVGTSTGLVGQAFVGGFNWFSNSQFWTAIATNPGADITLQATGAAPFNVATPWLYIGLSVRICQEDFNAPNNYQIEGVFGKIVAIPANNQMDIVMYEGNPNPASPKYYCVIGKTRIEIQKFTQLSAPVTQKQLTEMWLTVSGVANLPIAAGEFIFTQAAEVAFVNILAYGLFGGSVKKNFTQAEVTGNLYNKVLNEVNNYADVTGFRLQFISNGLLQLSDISVCFENA